ncbi:MAG: 3'(2'),5'-bisphosphate nucleotidase CysQ family protein, partial [Xanthobacteraceae bacterium]
MPTLDASACTALLQPLTLIGARAALTIRKTARDSGIRNKEDGSPVTAADIAAEATIRAGLSALVPALPIVSEEQAEHPRPAQDGSYFLVDPLDGTREFIAGRDEYTVNIALVTDGAPVLGVIVAPGLGRGLGLIWRGIAGKGAERLAMTADGKLLSEGPIHARARPPHETIVVVSRSHLDARTRDFLASLPQPRPIPCGSALKFCRIAEGAADLYPRLAPTHDWDVGAGHAIIVAAGG